LGFEAKKRLGLWMLSYIEGWFIWPEPSSTLHALRRLKDSNPGSKKIGPEGVPVIPSLMLNALHHRREEVHRCQTAALSNEFTGDFKKQVMVPAD